MFANSTEHTLQAWNALSQLQLSNRTHAKPGKTEASVRHVSAKYSEDAKTTLLSSNAVASDSASTSGDFFRSKDIHAPSARISAEKDCRGGTSKMHMPSAKVVSGSGRPLEELSEDLTSEINEDDIFKVIFSFTAVFENELRDRLFYKF